MSKQELIEVAQTSNRIAPDCYHRVAEQDFQERLAKVTLWAFCYPVIAGLIILIVVTR
jgi:hypothetical protein